MTRKKGQDSHGNGSIAEKIYRYDELSNPNFWLVGFVLPERAQETFHFRSLWSARRQASQEFGGLFRCLGSTAGSREGKREGESRLMQVGIEGQGALQLGNRRRRLAGVSQDQAEICGHDGVVWFDVLGRQQRLLRGGAMFRRG